MGANLLGSFLIRDCRHYSHMETATSFPSLQDAGDLGGWREGEKGRVACPGGKQRRVGFPFWHTILHVAWAVSLVRFLPFLRPLSPVPGTYVTCLNGNDNAHPNWPADGCGQDDGLGCEEECKGTGEICCRLAMHANATFATVWVAVFSSYTLTAGVLIF